VSADLSKHEAPAPGSALDGFISFLKRVVSTLFGAKPPKDHIADEISDPPVAASATEPPMEPLLDIRRLSPLAFQRKVLDWRDEAHVDITLTMTTLHQTFRNHIDRRLKEAGPLGRFFGRPADEVLQHEFTLRLQQTMNSCLSRLETSLTALAKEQAPTQAGHLHFRKELLIAEHTHLRGLKFKPSEHKTLLRELETWMLGSRGLVAEFRDQATHMAERLTQETHA